MTDTAPRPATTYGLTHLAVRVKDPQAAAEFYTRAIGARVTYSDANHVEVQTPGAKDVIAFVRGTPVPGGVEHFGFRLRRRSGITQAVAALKNAGATDLRQGEFGPGQPYVFARDPNGYEIEIWFEPPLRGRRR
jgi:catechol 2,3-dioxygenase-like lactoylglutathione lyase family enzyme